MKLRPSRPLSGPRTVVAAGTAGLLVVGAVGVVLVRGTGTGDEEARVAEASRVLQSVSATVDSDGTITALDGTVVAVDADGGTSTTTTEYSPEKMADQLPVRVRTSYRTDEGSGTDLADLEGHDGRVEIVLTVENLTVEPQELTYDVDGTQRTRTALVGVPLSIVASAGLGDIDPAAVVTDDAGGQATNGVLSRTDDDQTQVQWATIVAPPQLGTAATLRLVVDTDNFSPPDVDLSVQQGLVTDPSLGALVDAAFNPASSDELELQQRTISLIGDVNTVIARAGESIGDVRGTLRRSAESIGAKTVRDLQSSTRSIATSMSALGQTVDSLGNDLAGTLEATGSTAIAQLQTSVASLDTLLGDTRQTPPTAPVTGSGCESTVALPGRGADLYGSLLSVSSQLDAYAGATRACKAFVTQRLISTVGTATSAGSEECLDPTTKAPLPADQLSATCALFSVAEQFKTAASAFSTSYEPVRDKLLELKALDVTGASTGLTSAVTALSTAALGGTLNTDAKAKLDAVELAADETRDQVDDLVAPADDNRDGAQALANEIIATRTQVCAATPLTAAPISFKMVGVLDCAVPVDPADDPGDSLLGQALDQKQAWEALLTDATLVTQKLDVLDTSIDGLRSTLYPTGNPQDGGLGGFLENLTNATTGVVSAQNALVTRSTRLQQEIGAERVPAVTDDPATPDVDESRPAVPGTGLLGTLQNTFQGAEENISALVDGVTAAQTTRLVKQTAANAEDIGAAFTRSASGLAAAGSKVRSDGKATIEQQRGRLGASADKSAQLLTASVRGGLAQIQESVTGSVRDTDAAGELLQADLQNVLLDLGTREVDGSGLLGSMAASAATAGTANRTLAEATDSTTSFAGVRDGSIAGIYLRQAQADAALTRQAEQPAFGLDLPASAQHRTVYTFHVRAGS